MWACIRFHESGGNYATNTGNGYYGAYQFSERTWLGIGGTGYPKPSTAGGAGRHGAEAAAAFRVGAVVDALDVRGVVRHEVVPT